MNKITEGKVNSTQNNNVRSTVKGDNGFSIIASLLNSASDQYIQNYLAITFDSVPSMGVKKQADVTSYPVESGANVSDHVNIRNTTFSMSGVITESPIRLVKDLLYSSGVSGGRISQAIEYLDKIFNSRQPITLVDEHRVYKNVILKSISYDYKSEDAVVFDLEFEQIRLVSTATTNEIAFKTQRNKNTGGTTKTKVEPAQKDTVTGVFKQ